MWVVMMMAALMLGTMIGVETGSNQDEPDENAPPLEDVESAEPIIPLPDPAAIPDPAPIPAPQSAPDPTAQTDAILVSSDAVSGTQGDDRFELDTERDRSTAIELSAGAGNDTIDFSDPSGEPLSFSSQNFVSNASIDGGAGNDTIHIGARGSTIDGGAGDDIIRLEAAAELTVFGGDGDDQIIATTIGEDAIIEGGSGNDTIDAARLERASISGGAGDDLISVTGPNLNETGFGTDVDAGAGNDTINFDGAAFNPVLSAEEFPNAPAFPTILSGGDGSDTFDLRVNEGDESDVVTGAPEPSALQVIRLSDFEPGLDRIVIEPYAANDAFSITAARIEEDATRGVSNVILSYESDTQTNRDVVVSINAIGLTWDDITFRGLGAPAVLTPLV